MNVGAGLTVSLAGELSRHDVCVATLAPGIVRTPLTDDAVTGITLQVDGGCVHGW